MIVVVVAFEFRDQLVNAQTRRDRERAEVVAPPAADRRDEIGETPVRFGVRDDFLLPQHRKARRFLAATLIGEQDEVVAVAGGWPEAVDA